MAYLQYITIILLLPLLYTIPNTILSITIGLIKLPKQIKPIILIFGRFIRAYLYSSVLLLFAYYFIALGLTNWIIFTISYFGLLFAWAIETRSASINFAKSIEFQFAVDLKELIGFIYTLVFILCLFFKIPLEPWLSGLTLLLITKLITFKIFLIFISITGLGTIIFIASGIFSFLGYSENDSFQWTKYFLIVSKLPINLISETFQTVIDNKATFQERIKNILLLFPLLILSPLILFIAFLLMRRQNQEFFNKRHK